MQRFLPASYRTLLLVAVLFTVAVLVFELFQNLNNASRSNAMVEHTYQVLLQSDKLAASLSDVEIGQFRYLLTGQEERLNIYKTGLRNLPQGQTELHRLVADNPGQIRRLQELDTLLASRLAVVAKRIEVRRGQGLVATTSQVNSDGGVVIGRRIRVLLAEIIAAEQALLKERQTIADRQFKWTRKILVVGSILLLALLTCIGYILERDVTMRRRAEREVRSNEVLFRGVFDNASVGIALLTAAGEFQLVNSRFCEITGYASSQLLQRTFQSITFPDDEPGFNLLHHLARPGETAYAKKKRCLRGDGSSTWVNLKASSLPPTNGNAERFISIIEDINAQVQAEAALQAANLSLVRSNESLKEFAYVASHDLQEPLRTVSMYSQLLSRELKSSLDGRGEKFLTIITDGAKRMSQLIEALLAYSQASSDDKQSHKRLNLHDLLNESLENLRSRVEEEHAVITCDQLPVVYGDPVRLEQVLQNLLGNALKYRRPDIQPQIHVGCQRLADEWLFCVRDNGLGFDPKFAERIFGVFKRLHGNEIAGAGVGLSVVKTVVQRHGGRVWAESAGCNCGAAFYFSLPVAAA